MYLFMFKGKLNYLHHSTTCGVAPGITWLSQFVFHWMIITEW